MECCCFTYCAPWKPCSFKRFWKVHFCSHNANLFKEPPWECALKNKKAFVTLKPRHIGLLCDFVAPTQHHHRHFLGTALCPLCCAKCCFTGSFQSIPITRRRFLLSFTDEETARGISGNLPEAAWLARGYPARDSGHLAPEPGLSISPLQDVHETQQPISTALLCPV